MKITPSYQLQKHNTFALACQASFFIELEGVDDAKVLHQDEYFRTLPFLILGGGSNMLFLGDFKGAVLHYSYNKVSVKSDQSDKQIWRVAAGANWHSLVMKAATEGLWGIENLALIPGEVGAAAVQNIGAYGAEIAQVVEAVHTINLVTGEEETWTPKEIEYDYRYSIFKEEHMRHLLVYAVDIRLSKEPLPNLSYRGLQSLEEVEGTLTPLMVAEEVVRIREEKLPDPTMLPNAGSFFMNPVVDGHTFLKLLEQYPDMPHYVVSEQEFKIPAAWMIEQVGLKGVREGEVGTYPKQPLVLVNYGTTVGRDVANFSEMVQEKVYQQFGVMLKPEVRFVLGVQQYSINQLDQSGA